MLISSLACLFVLSVARVLFIRLHINDSQVTQQDYINVLWQGVSYDMKVSAYVVTLLLFISVLPSIAFRSFSYLKYSSQLLATLVLLLIVALSVVNVEYFREYHDGFNHFALGVLYDDMYAVWSTIYADYGVWKLSIIIIFLIIFVFLCFIIFGFLFGIKPKLESGKVIVILSVAIFILLLTILYRGGIQSYNYRKQNANITQNKVLNTSVINAVESLRYMLKDFAKANDSENGIEQFGFENIEQAVKYLPNCKDKDQLLGCLSKRISPLGQEKPSHIFYIVMESFDLWPLLTKEYQSLGLLDEFQTLSKDGILIKHHLPASTGTMTSLAAIVSGLLDTGIATNYQASSKATFPTALAPKLEHLGYETNFIYAGVDSWQRIKAFVQDQGFKHVLSAPHMANFDQLGIWGVTDQQMFDFVKNKHDMSKPSFNLLLSVSNHPPYTIDLEKEGIVVEQIQARLSAIGAVHDFQTAHQFGHLKYSQREVVRFIRAMEERFPDALFVVTGDHWSRRIPNQQTSSQLAQAGVPLLLYGKQVLPQAVDPKKLFGSHVDIAATLVSLASSEEQTIVTLGDNILQRQSSLSLSRDRYLTQDGFGVRGNFELWGDAMAETAEYSSFWKQNQAYHAVAWYLLTQRDDVK